LPYYARSKHDPSNWDRVGAAQEAEAAIAPWIFHRA
jgi:hypothetical protein